MLGGCNATVRNTYPRHPAPSALLRDSNLASRNDSRYQNMLIIPCTYASPRLSDWDPVARPQPLTHPCPPFPLGLPCITLSRNAGAEDQGSTHGGQSSELSPASGMRSARPGYQKTLSHSGVCSFFLRSAPSCRCIFSHTVVCTDGVEPLFTFKEYPSLIYAEALMPGRDMRLTYLYTTAA